MIEFKKQIPTTRRPIGPTLISRLGPRYQGAWAHLIAAITKLLTEIVCNKHETSSSHSLPVFAHLSLFQKLCHIFSNTRIQKLTTAINSIKPWYFIHYK